MKALNILVLCGPSGQGKSFVEKELINKSSKTIEFKKLEQVTTRDRRPEEIGLTPEKSYHFLTNKEYNELNENNKLIGCMSISYPEYNIINYYGSLFDINDLISYLNNSKSKKVVFSIILNKGAIYDFYNKLDNMQNIFNEKELKVNTLLYFIDGNNDIKRENRDDDFVLKEREDLINNFNSIMNRKYFNDFNKRKFINLNYMICDIKKDLKINEYLDKILNLGV